MFCTKKKWNGFLDKLDKMGWSYWLLNKVKTISNIYIDLCKDTFILVSILIIIGGPTSLYYFPTKLTSVIVYSFTATIVLPFMCSSILHTQKELENHEDMRFWRVVLAYCYGLILSPIRPLLIAMAYEENKAKRKSMIKFHNKEAILKLNQESENLRKDYADFIRVDLGLEVLYQLCGQVSLN